jgi:hypothetical protein
MLMRLLIVPLFKKLILIEAAIMGVNQNNIAEVEHQEFRLRQKIVDTNLYTFTLDIVGSCIIYWS